MKFKKYINEGKGDLVWSQERRGEHGLWNTVSKGKKFKPEEIVRTTRSLSQGTNWIEGYLKNGDQVVSLNVGKQSSKWLRGKGKDLERLQQAIKNERS